MRESSCSASSNGIMHDFGCSTFLPIFWNYVWLLKEDNSTQQ